MKKHLTLLMLILCINVYSQNVVQKELKGRWKMQKNENFNNTDINFGEFLKFNDNEINFFKIESGKEEEESIKKITFIYDFGNQHYNNDRCQLIKFENGEVWELTLRLINNETRLIWELKMDKNGSFIILADDRGVIKNPELRKKALEGEINTYYIKIK
ncbi:hypothetical protein [Flavobacterium sp. 5]|uniref:hypothetical protein n=1 Tax=Flavobacterium sp. 5 TaxID=2035199 RepID=UPI000C2B8338|nr:hypothetical protein [Flavobacterium sp. 5]PKB15727.1 hypothetical protein CLU82_0816 [Flavobacterium sp. 5]